MALHCSLLLSKSKVCVPSIPNIEKAKKKCWKEIKWVYLLSCNLTQQTSWDFFLKQFQQLTPTFPHGYGLALK